MKGAFRMTSSETPGASDAFEGGEQGQQTMEGWAGCRRFAILLATAQLRITGREGAARATTRRAGSFGAFLLLFPAGERQAH